MTDPQAPSMLSKILSNLKQKWTQFLNWFSSKPSKIKPPTNGEIHLEPKYWPEVMDLMETLNKLIETHTIDDINVRHVNVRILEYLEEQINTKGMLVNLDLRYSALETVADRFLTKSLDKIVGLKHQEDSHAEFSEAISIFKKRLHERHQEELKQN